jgi:hypothetical protein
LSSSRIRAAIADYGRARHALTAALMARYAGRIVVHGRRGYIAIVDGAGRPALVVARVVILKRRKPKPASAPSPAE